MLILELSVDINVAVELPKKTQFCKLMFFALAVVSTKRELEECAELHAIKFNEPEEKLKIFPDVKEKSIPEKRTFPEV